MELVRSVGRNIDRVSSLQCGLLAPECHLHLTVEQDEGLFKLVTMWRWTTEFKASVRHAAADHEALLDILIAVAAEVQSDPAKVAIAWVSAKGVIPIIGANTRLQLDANLGASLIRLDAEQIARLDKVSAVPAGYPHEALGSEGVRAMLTGNRWNQIDLPIRSVR